MKPVLSLAFAALLLFLAAAATAQSYPVRPVRIIVPFASGGSADIYGRALSPRLQEIFGQPFVIEDRPGAGSISMRYRPWFPISAPAR